MRVPHEPQKAKPGAIKRPQLGQEEALGPAADGAVPDADMPETICPDWTLGTEEAVHPPDPRGWDHGAGGASVAVVSGAVRSGDIPTGGGVGPPLNPGPGVGAVVIRPTGIFGESFQGIPPLGLAVGVGSGVFAMDENPTAAGARSRGNGVLAGSTTDVSGANGLESSLGAALISFPQPRQNL